MAGNNEDQDKPQAVQDKPQAVQDKPPVVQDKPQVAGTANVLKQTKSYEGLVKEYGKAVANGLMKKAINDAVPAAQAVTSKDVSGFAKVTEALRSNPVDVAATAQQGMADAGQVVGDALRDLGKQPDADAAPAADATPAADVAPEAATTTTEDEPQQ
ncbi:hypothetical protein [Aeromonas dhakensis]|uniref:hypothetical protein n=1 Tax=Aeromonas dhakensis TaxID=196024 RepID=UPI0023790349|nr:hypothetical protein [Aeromonas dhakensis]MDD9212821.1 hypothetical protein [Aeromonas dhakensis]